MGVTDRIQMDAIEVQGESGLPKRNLTPQMVASELGVTKRTVLNWVAAGLPHDKRNLQGVTSPAFHIDEVHAWMKRTGRGGAVKRGRPSKSQPKRAESASDSQHSSSGPTAASGGNTSEQQLWDLLKAELQGPASYEQMMLSLKLKFSQLMNEAESGLGDPGAAQKITNSFKQISSEIRALELAEQERRVFRNEYVERVKAKQVLTATGDTIRASMTTLVSKLVQAVLEIFGPKFSDASEIEILRRTLANRLRNETDSELTRICDGIEKHAASIE